MSSENNFQYNSINIRTEQAYTQLNSSTFAELLKDKNDKDAINLLNKEKDENRKDNKFNAVDEMFKSILINPSNSSSNKGFNSNNSSKANKPFLPSAGKEITEENENYYISPQGRSKRSSSRSSSIRIKKADSELVDQVTPIYSNNKKSEIAKIISTKSIPRISLPALQPAEGGHVKKKRNSKLDKRRHTKRSVELNPQMLTEMIHKSEKGSNYTRYTRFMRVGDRILAILLCINIVLSIIDNELYIDQSSSFLQGKMNTTEFNFTTQITLPLLREMRNRTISDEENSVRVLNGLSSCLCVLLVISHYFFYMRLMIIDNKLSKYDNIFSSGLYKWMLLEMLVAGLFYPPHLNNVYTGLQLGISYAYNFNAFISVLSIFKLFFVFRVFTFFSRWCSDTAIAVCNKYKVKAGSHFAIKAEMRKRPLHILSFLLVITTCLLAFAIRTFEYGVYEPKRNNIKGSTDLQSLMNCFWLVIVTMTTVGYGDFYPRSHLGRLVGVLACIIGMLLLSLIVVSLGSISEFTPDEKKAFSKLKKLLADDNMENKAANVITSLLQIRKLVSHGLATSKRHTHHSRLSIFAHSLTERFILFTQLKREISLFKNDYKIANSYSLPVDEMLRRIENKLQDDLIKLGKNIKKIDKLDETLEDISKDQDLIQERLRKVMHYQEDIAKYIVMINNDTYKQNIIKRRESLAIIVEKTNRKKSSFFNPNIQENLRSEFKKKSNKNILALPLNNLNQAGMQSNRSKKSSRTKKPRDIAALKKNSLPGNNLNLTKMMVEKVPTLTDISHKNLSFAGNKEHHNLQITPIKVIDNESSNFDVNDIPIYEGMHTNNKLNNQNNEFKFPKQSDVKYSINFVNEDKQI
jgi:hypothetical protein